LFRDTADFVGSMKVITSKNNVAFYQYIIFMGANQKKMTGLTKTYEAAPEGSALRDSIKAVSIALNTEVAAFQKKSLMKTRHFYRMMVKMSMDVELPEPPRDSNGVITDSNFVYNYYIAHFWTMLIE